MTRVLLRLTVILMVIFVALVGIIRYTAQAYAAPQKLFSFDPPGCYLPCVFGVTPGKTMWAEYRDLIVSKVPVAQQDSLSKFWLDNNGYTQIEISGDYPGNDKMKILVHLDVFASSGGKFTTLRSILSAQYMPVRVFRYQGLAPGGVPLLIVLGNDQRIIVSVWAEDRFTPDTEVDWIIILGDSEKIGDVLVESGVKADEIRWLGFTSVDKYLNEPIEQ